MIIANLCLQKMRDHNRSRSYRRPSRNREPDQRYRDTRSRSPPSNYRSHKSSSRPGHKYIKVMIRVIIQDKFVKARVDTGTQETYIGDAIARYVQENSGAKAKRILLRDAHSIESMKELDVEIGIRTARMKRLTCIIDNRLPKYAVVLGMHGLKALGYKLQIGGVSAVQHIELKRNKDFRTKPTRWLRSEDREDGPSNHRRQRQD